MADFITKDVSLDSHGRNDGTFISRGAGLFFLSYAELDALVAWRTRQADSDYDVIERQLQGKPCGRDVPGTVPSWAGEDQVSPCPCVLDPGHSGAHECAHEGQRR